MKLNELKDILWPRFPNPQFCAIWSETQHKTIEDNANICPMIEKYGNNEVTHIEAFNDLVVISIKTEV